MEPINADQIKIQPLDHLGLISATIEKLGLVAKIDKLVPVSMEKGAKITMGQRVAAMILNGLGFIDDRLYMFPEFLSNKPVARLLGEGANASDFNDDALGRCLDAIYNHGVTQFFSDIAFSVGIENNLLGKSAHFDTSSISVYGDYAEIAGETLSPNIAATALKPPASDDAQNKAPIKITHGYSKDHRPDLKQMVINLATTGASGFPLWMEAHSGNASDKTILQAAAERMRKFCQQLKESPSFLYVGDSAMYENCVKKAGAMKWLSRVPETIKEAQVLIHQADQEFVWCDRGNGYRTTPIQSAYGSVAQRWLLVYSEKAFSRESKTVDKKIEQEKKAFENALWHLSNQEFQCEKDANKAAKACGKNMKYHLAEFVISIVKKHEKKGRPKKDEQAFNIQYFITGKLKKDEEKIAAVRRAKGRFILATNELDETKISDAEILPEYKEQSKTESGFRFIKGNAMEVTSVFLKKASRIEALRR